MAERNAIQKLFGVEGTTTGNAAAKRQLGELDVDAEKVETPSPSYTTRLKSFFNGHLELQKPKRN